MPQLGSLSFSEIESSIQNNAVLVIPIAALEPMGKNVPINVFQVVTDSISNRLAEKSEILTAPLMAVPYATPLKSFGGTLTLRKSVFMNAIADMVLTACSWGIRKVLFLDGTVYSKKVIDKALRNYKSRIPSDFSYAIVSWQNEKVLTKAVKEVSQASQTFWRNELAALLLYNEITGKSIPESAIENRNISEKQFQQWLRKGMDPEKLRAYFPEGQFASWEGAQKSDSLLDTVVKSIIETVQKGYIFHGI